MASSKPQTHEGYDQARTLDCERVLVTLLRGLGPYREHVRLVGGLCPRYLCPEAPPNVPAHVGTQDVDLVVSMLLLDETTEAYATLAENLHRMRFERSIGGNGQPMGWRWERRIGEGATVLLEFLKDAGDARPGRAQDLKGTGVSALAIPHAGMALDWFEQREVTAELLDDAGMTTEMVRYADVVAFTCLKALAFNDRNEPKDAADLEHVLRFHRPDMTEIAALFQQRLQQGPHTDTARACLDLLRRRFTTSEEAEGWRKDGPVAVARFWLGDDAQALPARQRRQRDVAGMMEALLKQIP